MVKTFAAGLDAHVVPTAQKCTHLIMETGFVILIVRDFRVLFFVIKAKIGTLFALVNM